MGGNDAADDPLAEKEVITKNDLLDVPLILPERMNVQSELANWFGKDFGKLHICIYEQFGNQCGSDGAGDGLAIRFH